MNLLAILYGGSDGETKKILEDIIKLDKSSINQLLQLAKNMSNESYKQVNIILSDHIKKSDYIDSIKSICKMDKLSGNVDKINEFIEKYTNGLIKNCIENGGGFIEMILANVIYFKSDWQHKFEKHMTLDKTFHGTNGDRIVKMMKQTEDFKYAQSPQYQLLEMDYADNVYSMGLVLPASHDDLSLNYQSLVGLLNNMSVENVHVELPKFTMKVKTNFNNMINSIGLGELYEKLIVPKISDVDQYVQNTEQKIVIKVDEDGTELAIVTSMITFNCISPAKKSINFICDRQFLFYIRNKLNNVIVCLGRYA
jgi:serpin B